MTCPTCGCPGHGTIDQLEAERDQYRAALDECRIEYLAERLNRANADRETIRIHVERADRAETERDRLRAALAALCREVGISVLMLGTSKATESVSRAYMDGLDALNGRSPGETREALAHKRTSEAES